MSRPNMLDDRLKRQLARRLSRIEGQVRGIQEMVGRDEPLEDVVQQIAAAREALHGSLGEILRGTAEQTEQGAGSPGPAETRRLMEVVRLMSRYWA